MKRHAFILIVALLLAGARTAASAEPAMTAETVVAHRGFTLDDMKAQVSRNKDGAFLMEIPQILNTGSDKEIQGVLSGQSVETTGQVMPETVDNADGNRLRIVRSLIQCCAAHARQYSVIIEFAGKAPALKEMTWVKVIGTMSYKQEGGKTVPVVVVKEIKETTQPDDPLIK